MDLYGRYALSYNISITETAISAIFIQPAEWPYYSMVFNDYLAEQNCIHSMS